MLATCPNVNPPAIATGVGPNRRKIVYTQPPEGLTTDDDTTCGVSSAESSGIFGADSQAAPDTQHQYRTLLEVMAAATAAQANSAIAQPRAPTVAPVESAADKENAAPSTPSNTFSSSSYAKAMIEKAKSNVKKLPPKPSLEETLLKLSTYVVLSIL